MKLNNPWMTLCILTNGQVIPVETVCNTDAAANAVMASFPRLGVVATDEIGHVFLADVKVIQTPPRLV